MKILSTIFLAFLSTQAIAVKIDVKCFGDEVIITTEKITDALRGAYICSKKFDKPVAIIKNENFDDKLDHQDSVSFYVGEGFTLYREMLKKRFENFENEMNDHFYHTGEKDAYFKIDFTELYEKEEIEALINNAQSKYAQMKSNNAASIEHEPIYRKRYYSPETGRFLSPDPKGFRAGDPNFYRAMGNNPILYSDPFGLDYQVCQRALQGSSVGFYPLEHEYIRYSDGSTTSWGPSGSIWGSPGVNNTSDSGGSCGANNVTSSEQDQAMQEYARQNERNNYNFLMNNCRDFVNQTIRAGAR